MPRPKRYFRCSQEIVADPEVWEFVREFGDRAIFTWLQILIYLDRTENQWRLTGDWLAVLSRSVRQSSANLRRQIGWMTAKDWLQVGEYSADGSPLLLKASNWLKYNKTQEHKKQSPDSGKGSDGVPLLSSPILTSPNHSEDKKKDIYKSASPPAKQKRVLRSISDEDKPTEKHFSLGRTLGVDVGPEWGKFKNYCLAHDKRYANFEAAFRNWIATAAERKGAQHAMR